MVIFVAVVGVADGEPQPRPVAVVGVAAVVHALVVAAQLLCRLDEAVGTCGDLRLQRHLPPCDSDAADSKQRLATKRQLIQSPVEDLARDLLAPPDGFP